MTEGGKGVDGVDFLYVMSSAACKSEACVGGEGLAVCVNKT